jgi:hypothetical protein
MNWRLAMALWALALPGVVVMSWLALPLLIDLDAAPVPSAVLQVASAAQNALLTLLAAIAGTALAPKLGLSAPAVAGWATRRRSAAVDWRRQIASGAVGGVVGCAVLVVFHAHAPHALALLQEQARIPLLVRLLYGGVTEEILIRWGLLSLLAWLAWRVLAPRAETPPSSVLWLAILLSAVLFGLGHLPTVFAAVGALPASVVAYITIGNALFGIVAGYLFWRFGLEAAVLAHCLAHALAFLVHG